MPKQNRSNPYHLKQFLLKTESWKYTHAKRTLQKYRVKRGSSIKFTPFRVKCFTDRSPFYWSNYYYYYYFRNLQYLFVLKPPCPFPGSLCNLKTLISCGFQFYFSLTLCGSIWTSRLTCNMVYSPGGLLGNPKNGTVVKIIKIPPMINPNHHAPTHTGLSGVMFSL